jgi:hypothetical protein
MSVVCDIEVINTVTGEPERPTSLIPKPSKEHECGPNSKHTYLTFILE